MIGRTVLMIAPDGVRRHELTDWVYETSGRTPDNSTAVDGAATRIELKANDWNQVRCTVTGDIYN